MAEEKQAEKAAETAEPGDTAGRAGVPPPAANTKDTAGRAGVPPPAANTKKADEPDWKDLYARLLADFDNYKKRAARDREDTYRYAEADILKGVLASVDNLALALDKAKDPGDPFVKGVRISYDSLLKALKDHGAEPFDSLGKELDVEKMEAIANLPSAEVAEGKVSAEVKRGWMLKGKLLRAAQVVISSGAPAPAEPPKAETPAKAEDAKAEKAQ